MPGRMYVSGWSSRVDRSSLASRETIQDIGVGSGRSAGYQPGTSENSYEAIKARCLQNRSLWEDPDFPAVKESLFFKKAPSGWPNIQWKRPKEICANPQLFVGGASRMDIVQGVLGDCWLLAAVASLSLNPTMLNYVVPPDQSFTDGYAGIFRFRFWQYGRWVEVLVDDRLPTTNNRLIYMHSTERNEFWSALLEKAYAKLCSSYESLSGGLTSEALTDFTGGIVQRYELRSNAPKDLWQTMLKAKAKNALMGCSIDTPPGGQMEGILSNGLIVGHAYSITDVLSVQVQTARTSGKIPLVRIRNPWGDSHEWKGAWGDQSPEWQTVSAEEKKAMGLSFSHDGEFWMSFNDFVKEYQRLEICSPGPDSCMADTRAERWQATLFDGAWKQRVNAGGCRNNPTFWTNPQYHVKVVDPDPNDADGTGTIIVGLMQKDRRKLRREGVNELNIGYAIYKSPADCQGTLDSKFFRTHDVSARSSAFINLREVCDQHKLAPGNYVIVPSTFEPEKDGDFILRVYSESPANTARELDDATGTTGIQKDNLKTGKSESDKQRQEEGRQAFLNLAGADGEIDAYELKDILNQIFLKEFTFDGFSIDMTRSMVAMCDADMTGKLGFKDFNNLWDDIKACTRAFRVLDSDRNGYFNSYELRTALSSLGYKVSNATFNAIVMRYSDRNGRITFDDFVTIYMKLKSIFVNFAKKDPSNVGRAKFGVDEFAMMTMYS